MASRFAERSIPHLWDIFGLSITRHLPNTNGDSRATSASANKNNGSERQAEKDNSKQQQALLKSNGQGSDSAISVDSSEEEFSEDGRRGRRKSRRGRDNAHSKRGSSACTRREYADEDEEEFRHLERHLSMKKTIRKRIMRELQTAMVEDPSEFCAERRSAAISAHSLTFRRGRRGAPPPLPRSDTTDEPPSSPAAVVEQPGFLDMLKLADNAADADSGNDSPTRPSPAQEALEDSPLNGAAVAAANKRHMYDSYRQMNSFRLAMPDEEEADKAVAPETQESDASNAQAPDKTAQQAGNQKKSFWKRIMKNNKTSKR